MLDNYKQLSWKYLKLNKKRSLLTIIGIILSVALVSSIGLFLKALINAEIEEVKNHVGSYHLLFTKFDDELKDKIAFNSKVSRSGVYREDGEKEIKENLFINKISGTKGAFELLPCKLIEGQFPEDEKNIALEKWMVKELFEDASVGDKILVENKEYVLSGILENNIKTQEINKGIALYHYKFQDGEKPYLLLEISKKTNLKKALQELKNLGGKDDVIENRQLLTIQGVGDNTEGVTGLYFVTGIIIAIVVLATIAVIFNSFQISIVERIKQFGMLRAVGTTPRQIRNIVIREATFFAIIGVPVGLLCGIIAIYGIDFTFKLIGADSVIQMKPSISLNIMLISAAIGLVSVYISAFVPSFMAGRISPLVAISSRNSITKEKIKKRKNAIVMKVFGFEGQLAYKNIKRSRRRYRTTVFSIFISVLLFITFKSFMDMSLNISSNLNESHNIHFSVISSSNDRLGDSKDYDNIVREINKLPLVENTYKAFDISRVSVLIDKNMENEAVRNMENIYEENMVDKKGKVNLEGAIEIYDEKSMELAKKYIDSGEIDIDKLNEENGVIIIKKNTIYNEKTHKPYIGPIANIKVGDEIEVKIQNEVEEEESNHPSKVKVLAILESEPFNFRGANNVLKMITTEEMAKKLNRVEKMTPYSLNIQIDNTKNEEITLENLEKILDVDEDFRVINNIDQNKRSKSVILMVKILLYGFVIIVSLISSINIINTLTTNIILRKREFATIKSIGMTQKGLRKIIILEGLLYGIIGTIYGAIFGTGLSYLMFIGLGGIREFSWGVPWQAILIAGVAALVIGYLSVLAPLSRIKKANLIETIREDY
ncbi:ABC transporter permease [Clostridium sediminicola]|uniref:ABC transporter permease n=1 Tax=Clostridium sediminicola TaxID=3114879 RepID=UPI0031F25220